MITSNLTGVVCGNSDVLLDQLIDEGVHFDLILTDPPYNINKDFGNKSDLLPKSPTIYPISIWVSI